MRFFVLSLATLAAANAAAQDKRNGNEAIISLPFETSSGSVVPISLPVLSLPDVSTGTDTGNAGTMTMTTSDSGAASTGSDVTVKPTGSSKTATATAPDNSVTKSPGTGSTTVITSTATAPQGTPTTPGSGGQTTGGGAPSTTDTPAIAPTAFAHNVAAGVVALAGLAVAL